MASKYETLTLLMTLQFALLLMFSAGLLEKRVLYNTPSGPVYKEFRVGQESNFIIFDQ